MEVDRDKALDWLQKGAQPSDTARAILSYSGVVYKNHLQNGVKKGAFNQEEADRRFDAWMSEKNTKIEAKKTGLVSDATKAFKDRLAVEMKKSNDRADALTAKLAASIAPPPTAEEEAAPAAEEEAAPAAEAGETAAPAEGEAAE